MAEIVRGGIDDIIDENDTTPEEDLDKIDVDPETEVIIVPEGGDEPIEESIGIVGEEVDIPDNEE